ncbi:hypothetical protein yc1106_09920 [Curvularia clavata]|uniref:Zn(2)-C6 fungal-type domain-containing protein n=1 Tax=Curvularia clavata TaxID=95742 RepID=A0A9Q8ZFW8_CURCL|nr:hypothetical protein yc1106_09920 [Curvularia clavata]
MLGYISSTRRKSCTACVKAKRRCDLGYPFCKRCSVKGLDCVYPTARKTPVSVRDAELVIKHTAVVLDETTTTTAAAPATAAATSVEPDDNFGDLRVNAHDLGNIARQPWMLAALLSSSESESSESDVSTSEPDTWQIGRDESMKAPPLPLHRTLLPPVVVPILLNEKQSTAVIEGLCSLVTTMACSGAMPFLHPKLYPEYDQPAAYQDCVAISALYMMRNANNANILINSINAKIAALVKESKSWSLMQHLAAVQALVVYQIIRLFDPTLSAQEQAVKQNVLLERWATSLFHRSSYDMPSLAGPRERWVFAESLRRTLFMSVFTRCGWTVFSTGGLASQVHVLASMPVTKDTKRWIQEGEEEQCRDESMHSQDQGLVTYFDFALDWSDTKLIDELDSFGKLILAPCRGHDLPQLICRVRALGVRISGEFHNVVYSPLVKRKAE